MIQQNELRVGNWLSYNGLPFKINANHIVNLSVCFMLPIPLTEEVIEQLGFRKKPDDDITYYSPVGITLTRFGRVEREGYCLLAECKYLHQFQNLYYILSGKELYFDLKIQENAIGN
jgi:hypothetical protein